MTTKTAGVFLILQNKKQAKERDDALEHLVMKRHALRASF
jgi:hypothetical protein